MLTSRNMTQKAQELQVQFDVLHEKIARLRKAVAIETDPTLKLKFEKQLEEAEAESEQIDRELQQLEQQREMPERSRPPQEIRKEASAECEQTTANIEVVLKQIKDVEELTGVETDTPLEGSTKIHIEDVKKGKKVTGMTIKKV
jgi:DNA repair exonuclease SbcCD ATPase subunit